ncbi:MAG: hypothetical protein OXU62_13425 [Gammaproteobacteria bacterium]|nr:hypothetical protein [Gammaproteobacteria bacterium]
MPSSAPDAARESAPDDSSRVEEAAVSYDSVDAGVRALGRLEKAEFNRAQAEAVVLATRDLVGDLATKSEFKTDIARLEGDIANIRETMATKTDIARLDGEIVTIKETMATKTDIARLEGEIATIHQTMATQKDLAQGLAQLEARVNQNALRNVMWVVGINFVVIVGGLAIAVTVLIDALKV